MQNAGKIKERVLEFRFFLFVQRVDKFSEVLSAVGNSVAIHIWHHNYIGKYQKGLGNEYVDRRYVETHYYKCFS